MRSQLCLLLGGVLLILGCGRPRTPSANAEQGAAGAPRAVPVTTVKAARRDVPIYLDGIGTVTAYKTVTVRPQVDGKLEKVLFREGQTVRRGALLAQIDPRPFLSQLHQAEGMLNRDSSLLRNGKLNLERYQTLRKQNLVAQQQLDDQQAMVEQYDGAVAVAKAQIESAKLNLEYASITAPIDGVTGVRLVDEGNLVQKNDPMGIVVITQIDPIAVLFTLPQDDLSRIAQRMNEGTLRVEAYSREGQTRLGEGELIVLDNQINQATATLRLKAVFQNPQHLLWPNQFVKARLLLAVKKGAVVVPASAVQRGPKGPFVYVVKPAETAAPQPVEVEQLLADQALIGHGLEDGDEVITEGQNQLRPGAKVAPHRALVSSKEGGPIDRPEKALGRKPVEGTRPSGGPR